MWNPFPSLKPACPRRVVAKQVHSWMPGDTSVCHPSPSLWSLGLSLALVPIEMQLGDSHTCGLLSIPLTLVPIEMQRGINTARGGRALHCSKTAVPVEMQQRSNDQKNEIPPGITG